MVINVEKAKNDDMNVLWNIFVEMVTRISFKERTPGCNELEALNSLYGVLTTTRCLLGTNYEVTRYAAPQIINYMNYHLSPFLAKWHSKKDQLGDVTNKEINELFWEEHEKIRIECVNFCTWMMENMFSFSDYDVNLVLDKK